MGYTDDKKAKKTLQPKGLEDPFDWPEKIDYGNPYRNIGIEEDKSSVDPATEYRKHVKIDYDHPELYTHSIEGEVHQGLPGTGCAQCEAKNPRPVIKGLKYNESMRKAGDAYYATAPEGADTRTISNESYDAVEPPHYKRGPKIKVDITSVVSRGLHVVERTVNCIEIMRHIKDPRLATAFKYLWRVSFGGKREPGETRPQSEIDKRDLESAIWYIRDYIDSPVP